VAQEFSQQLVYEKLEAILENAVDAIITIDRAGIIQSANPATTRLFGYRLKELVGKNVSILMPKPYRYEHDQYLKNYLDHGIKKIIGIGREIAARKKDGRVFPAHLAISEIRVRDEILFTGILRDISDIKAADRKLAQWNQELEERVRLRTQELKAVQDELIRSEKLATLGQVAGGIAHEIRNPLNAIKTSAYFLLQARQANAEKVREHLERIDRQVTLIDNVITALSDVAKLPAAKLGAVKIEEIRRKASQSTAVPANIRIVFKFAPELPPVLVDENQIPIAFRNLIRNARDAMPEGGELILGAEVVGAYVSAFVADTGVGIPSDCLELILEPMYTTKAKGMGLGLAITRAIVIRNNCELEIKSEQGEGSRFSIRIPVADIGQQKRNDDAKERSSNPDCR